MNTAPPATAVQETTLVVTASHPAPPTLPMRQLKAIRAKCLDCTGWTPKGVRHCPFDGVHSHPCPLWPFRFGCSPATASRRHGKEFLSPEHLPGAGMRMAEPSTTKFPTQQLKAIRLYCLECCGGKSKIVKYCTLDGINSTPCGLWLFRFRCSPATARRRYGEEMVTPGQLPGADVLIESLPP